MDVSVSRFWLSSSSSQNNVLLIILHFDGGSITCVLFDQSAGAVEYLDCTCA